MGPPEPKRAPEDPMDVCPEAGVVSKGAVDFILTLQPTIRVQLCNWLLSWCNCVKRKHSYSVIEERWWYIDSWHPCRQSDFCSLPSNCWSDASSDGCSLSHRNLLGKAQGPSDLKEDKLITSGWLGQPWH